MGEQQLPIRVIKNPLITAIAIIPGIPQTQRVTRESSNLSFYNDLHSFNKLFQITVSSTYVIDTFT
jgi:hypothetical protein